MDRNEENELETSASNHSGIVELNVGGKIFATSRETLMNQGSAYFERLLESGESCGAVVRGALRDKDGRLFIDRSPELFGPILEYLRSSQIPPHYKDLLSHNKEKMALMEEAKYYQLESLEVRLQFSGGGYDASCLSYEDLQIRNQAAQIREDFQRGRASAVVDATNALIPLFDPETGKLLIPRIFREPCTSPDATILFQKHARHGRRREEIEKFPQTLDEFRRRFLSYAGPLFRDFTFRNVVVAGGALLECFFYDPTDESASQQYGDVSMFLIASDAEEARAEYDRVFKHFALERQREGDSFIDHDEMLLVRSANGVTLVVGYPQRNVHVFIPFYSCAAEVIFSYDIDCNEYFWDGNNVYATPSGHRALVSGIIFADPEQRIADYDYYETALANFASKGFLVAVPGLDLQRVDTRLFRDSFFTRCGDQLYYVHLHFHAPGDVSFTVDQEEVIGLRKLLVYSNLVYYEPEAWGDDTQLTRLRRMERELNRRRFTGVYLIDLLDIMTETKVEGRHCDWELPTPPYPPPPRFLQSASDEFRPLIEYGAIMDANLVLTNLDRPSKVLRVLKERLEEVKYTDYDNDVEVPLLAYTYLPNVRDSIACPEIEDAQVQYPEHHFIDYEEEGGELQRYLEFDPDMEVPQRPLDANSWTDGTYYDT
jgi:hypothetical protein